MEPLLQVERIRVHNLIGSGGFARVYAATYDDPASAKTVAVALKVMKVDDGGRENEYEKLFLREATATKNLEHRSIVRCLGVVRLPPKHPGIPGLTRPTWGMVLELCEPYTTKSLITQGMAENRRTYTNRQALEWLLQIASALVHLHSARPTIIHRDIKQENLLLKREPRKGGKLVAKLSDLGLHVVLENTRSVMLRCKSHPRHSVHRLGAASSPRSSSPAPLAGAAHARLAAPARAVTDPGTSSADSSPDGRQRHTRRSPFLALSAAPSALTSRLPSTLLPLEPCGGAAGSGARAYGRATSGCSTAGTAGREERSGSTVAIYDIHGPAGTGAGPPHRDTAKPIMIFDIHGRGRGSGELSSSCDLASLPRSPVGRSGTSGEAGSRACGAQGSGVGHGAGGTSRQPNPHAAPASGQLQQGPGAARPGALHRLSRMGGSGPLSSGQGATSLQHSSSEPKALDGCKAPAPAPAPAPSSRCSRGSRDGSGSTAFSVHTNPGFAFDTAGAASRGGRPGMAVVRPPHSPAGSEQQQHTQQQQPWHPHQHGQAPLPSAEAAGVVPGPSASQQLPPAVQPAGHQQGEAKQLPGPTDPLLPSISFAHDFPPGAIPLAQSRPHPLPVVLGARASCGGPSSPVPQLPFPPRLNAPHSSPQLPASATATALAARSCSPPASPSMRGMREVGPLGRHGCIDLRPPLECEQLVVCAAPPEGSRLGAPVGAEAAGSVCSVGAQAQDGAGGAAEAAAGGAAVQAAVGALMRGSCTVGGAAAASEGDVAAAAGASCGGSAAGGADPRSGGTGSLAPAALPAPSAAEFVPGRGGSTLPPLPLALSPLPAPNWPATQPAHPHPLPPPAAATAAVPPGQTATAAFAQQLCGEGSSVMYHNPLVELAGAGEEEAGGGSPVLSAFAQPGGAPDLAGDAVLAAGSSAGSVCSSPRSSTAVAMRGTRGGGHGARLQGMVGAPAAAAGCAGGHRASAPVTAVERSVLLQPSRKSLEGPQPALPRCPISGPVESIGTLITNNPGLVHPVPLSPPGAAGGGRDAISAGLRRVRSVLQQLQQEDLRTLRQSSIEWVFGLTGQAGSCMAPEVFRQLPYNEKADVFSFGVLMYELWARELLVITYFNTVRGKQLGVNTPEEYADQVCQGFRPPRHKVFGDQMWSLIEQCWHDDPVSRPSMETVVDRLEELLAEEEAHPSDPRGLASSCGCAIS